MEQWRTRYSGVESGVLIYTIVPMAKKLVRSWSKISFRVTGAENGTEHALAEAAAHRFKMEW